MPGTAGKTSAQPGLGWREPMSEDDEDGAANPPDRAGTRRTARLEAFSDGIFAFAITLLVLDLAIPAASHSERHILDEVGHGWPGYLGYVVSFSTIGALWLGHSAVTEYLDHADVTLMRLNLLLLLFVSFLPFPTRLISDYVDTDQGERVAVTFYGVTLLVTATLLSLLWRYARHAGLVRPDARDQEITLLTRRLTPGIGGYGALIVLGLFRPVAAIVGYLAIAVFFLLPLRPHLLKRLRSRRIL